MATSASAVFTADRVAQVARQAAATVGLPHDKVELVRLGEAAVMRLPDGVVARVTRGMGWAESAEREVRVATALAAGGVSCIRPLPVPQPVTAGGHPVTFWEEIPGPLTPPSAAEFGALLRVLHDAVVAVDLPPLDPWALTADRIEHAPIGEAERRVLRGVLIELQQAWAGVSFGLDVGVIHGDAHRGNAVRAADGSCVLVDLETVCVGPREWDLVPTGLSATALGWITPTEYRAFVDAYGGFDVTAAPAFGVLCRMRELRMTSWLAQHARESDRLAAEVAHRVACLADPALPRRWSPR